MMFSQKINVVKVFITTSQKLFSEWKLEEVFNLYGLGEKVDFTKFDPFKCCGEPANGYISDLLDGLKEAYLRTPLNQFTEATKSIYSLARLLQSLT